MTKPPKSGQSDGRSATSRDRGATQRDRGAALLPEGTTDERELVDHRDDEWYERERPPHHG